MKKLFSLLYLLIIFNTATFSQQDPQFTNNMFYKLGVNPGFAGAEDAINGLILKRYQWEGMIGAPKTTVFAVDAAVDIFGSPGGLGFNIVNDQLGFEKNISVNASYAYKTELSIGRLGVGLSLGLFNKSINGNWEVPDDINNLGIYTQPTSDPYIPQGETSQMAFDLGTGVYLSSNKYFLGLSVTHLNQAPIVYAELVSAYLSRHYYFMGGYNIKLTDPLFELRPSVLLKTDLAGWQMDVNANVIYDDRFWGGLSFRMNDAIALLVGLEMFNGLNLGYSFDLVTSSIGYYGFASHEIFINYSIDLERDRNKKYKSIRFL
jgi:type IX secretion system PorP/SprF family membrane protein